MNIGAYFNLGLSEPNVLINKIEYYWTFKGSHNII